MPTIAKIHRSLAVVALLLLPTRVMAKEPNTGERWTATLKGTAARLAGGEFEEALGPLRELTEEMLDVLGSSSEADRFFALAMTQLALAEAGTKNVDEAIWHWHTAQNIDRAVSTLDLSAYGEAGRALSERRLPPRPDTCAHRPDGIPPPVVAKRREPRFPEGARRARASGIVIVHVQIDEGGNISDPQVMKAFPATLVFSTLEALRQWRFEPYAVEGSPTATNFCVTFNFKLVK